MPDSKHEYRKGDGRGQVLRCSQRGRHWHSWSDVERKQGVCGGYRRQGNTGNATCPLRLLSSLPPKSPLSVCAAPPHSFHTSLTAPLRLPLSQSALPPPKVVRGDVECVSCVWGCSVCVGWRWVVWTEWWEGGSCLGGCWVCVRWCGVVRGGVERCGVVWSGVQCSAVRCRVVQFVVCIAVCCSAACSAACSAVCSLRCSLLCFALQCIARREVPCSAVRRRQCSAA